MNRSAALRFARLVAWPIGVGALVLVATRYEMLPDTLPLTRWSSAPKSWVTALRVPAICLVSLGLVEVVCASIRRLSNFERAHELTTILLFTAAWKSAGAALSLVLLPRHLVIPDSHSDLPYTVYVDDLLQQFEALLARDGDARRFRRCILVLQEDPR